MTKQFTTLQLFSIVDGRLSTTMDDIYDILNHLTDDNLMTHHLPVAMDYVKEKNPKWFQEQTGILDRIKKTIPSTDFKDVIYIVGQHNETVDVPQLKDEFDTSDFSDYMVGNSLLLKRMK